MNGELMGHQAQDTIVGFEGIVVGHARYVSGCSMYLLAPRVSADGSHRDSEWFDEQRIVADLATPAVEFDNAATPGPDRPAPVR